MMLNELLWLGIVRVICITTILIFWRQDKREEKRRDCKPC